MSLDEYRFLLADELQDCSIRECCLGIDQKLLYSMSALRIAHALAHVRNCILLKRRLIFDNLFPISGRPLIS